MGQVVQLHRADSAFAERFAWAKPDKVARPAAPPRKLKKPRRRKWLWYRPTNFASAHGRMSKSEVQAMDAEYRLMFGKDRGGQKAEREGTYKRDFCVAEFGA